MVYDATHERVVMFGGTGRSGETDVTLDDIWSWDGERWTEIAAAGGPTPRRVAAMVCDVARRELVVFGGYDGTNLRDTWLLRTDDATDSDEQCHTGFDGNGDHEIGCADPDCAASCERCGNGQCDPEESCRLCPRDCGMCQVCGDLHCDAGEGCTSCPGDCGACSRSEGAP
jgi:hypothetical protein